MRLVSWNLAYNTPGFSSRHDEAWEYLFGLEPDVAFVQESKPPSNTHGFDVIWREAFEGGWGSAVVGHGLKRYEPQARWLHHYQGWVTAAEITLDGHTVHLFSTHASWRPVADDLLTGEDISRFPLEGRKGVWPLHLIFEDLTDEARGSPLLIGGDLNADPIMDTKSGFVGGNTEFFDSLPNRGLHDLSLSSPQPTHRGYTLDYLFSGGSLRAQVSQSSIKEDPVGRKLSDHAPLIVDLAGLKWT